MRKDCARPFVLATLLLVTAFPACRESGLVAGQQDRPAGSAAPRRAAEAVPRLGLKSFRNDPSRA